MTRDRLLREMRVALLVGLPVVLLGPPAGLLWAALRPSFDGAQALLEESRLEVQLTSDLRYLLVVAVAGLLAGVLTWVATRRNGLGAITGLVLGGVAAALVARSVGVHAAHPAALPALLERQFDARGLQPFSSLSGYDRAMFLADLRFELRATSMVLVLPAVAVGTFALLTWRRPRLVLEPASPPRTWAVAGTDGQPVLLDAAGRPVPWVSWETRAPG